MKHQTLLQQKERVRVQKIQHRWIFLLATKKQLSLERSDQFCRAKRTLQREGRRNQRMREENKKQRASHPLLKR